MVKADGSQHGIAAGIAHDAARTRYLAESGVRVVRFTNHEVLRESERVLAAIWLAVTGEAG